MSQSERSPDDVAELARADLLVVREREGDAAALQHARQVARAAIAFIASDIDQPRAARELLDELTVSISHAHPDSRPTLQISDDGHGVTAALMGSDTKSTLIDVTKLLGLGRATECADAMVRASLGFLVDAYQADHVRDFVKGLPAEVEKLAADRGLPPR